MVCPCFGLFDAVLSKSIFTHLECTLNTGGLVALPCPSSLGTVALSFTFTRFDIDRVPHFCHITPMKTTKAPEWPKIVTVGNASVNIYKRAAGYQIVYHGTDGQRKFESEQDEAQAIKRATKKAETLSTFGARAAQAKPQDMADWVRLSDVLAPFSLTLPVVVDRVANWLTKFKTLDGIDQALTSGGEVTSDGLARSVAAVVKEFTALKESNGIRPAYLKAIKFRLGQFQKRFVCDIGTVTTAQIQGWLDGMNLKAAGYNTSRTHVFMLFGYCVTRGYLSKNPVEKVEVRKAKSTRDAVIYTPAEMVKLLASCTNGFQARIAISGFAGLRTAEIRRLDWKQIDLEQKVIRIDADQAKTSSRRVVPMTDNLCAWLANFKNHIGKVCTAKTEDVFLGEQRTVAELAGVPWRLNGLRHSFCSYRLALVKNAPQVAFEAGNSPVMIDRHYKALVTEQQAAQWFAIMPPAKTPASV